MWMCQCQFSLLHVVLTCMLWFFPSASSQFFYVWLTAYLSVLIVFLSLVLSLQPMIWDNKLFVWSICPSVCPFFLILSWLLDCYISTFMNRDAVARPLQCCTPQCKHIQWINYVLLCLRVVSRIISIVSLLLSYAYWRFSTFELETQNW